MKRIYPLILFFPLVAHAVMFEWRDPGSKFKTLSGTAPECYRNPTPQCPRIRVYENGQLIDDTGDKNRNSAAVEKATAREQKQLLYQYQYKQQQRQDESIQEARQAASDARQAESEAYKAQNEQMREDIKEKSQHFLNTIKRITK